MLYKKYVMVGNKIYYMDLNDLIKINTVIKEKGNDLPQFKNLKSLNKFILKNLNGTIVTGSDVEDYRDMNFFPLIKDEVNLYQHLFKNCEDFVEWMNFIKKGKV